MWTVSNPNGLISGYNNIWKKKSPKSIKLKWAQMNPYFFNLCLWCSIERGPPGRPVPPLSVPLPLGREQRLGLRAHGGQEAVPGGGKWLPSAGPAEGSTAGNAIVPRGGFHYRPSLRCCVSLRWILRYVWSLFPGIFPVHSPETQ